MTAMRSLQLVLQLLPYMSVNDGPLESPVLVMAYIVMASVIMGYIVMACVDMAYVIMAYVVMAYIGR